MCFAYMYVLDTASRPGAQGDQKKSSDPLKPELRMVVNHHVDAGNKQS